MTLIEHTVALPFQLNFEIFNEKKHKLEKKGNNSDPVVLVTETSFVGYEVEW